MNSRQHTGNKTEREGQLFACFSQEGAGSRVVSAPLDIITPISIEFLRFLFGYLSIDTVRWTIWVTGSEFYVPLQKGLVLMYLPSLFRTKCIELLVANQNNFSSLLFSSVLNTAGCEWLLGKLALLSQPESPDEYLIVFQWEMFTFPWNCQQKPQNRNKRKEENDFRLTATTLRSNQFPVSTNQ